MAALKIVFLAGDRQIVLYGQGLKQMWQVESHVLERLGKDERLKLDTAEFRKFWIDEEGDRVEIMNNYDYEFFLKRICGQSTPKIYFEAIYPSKVPQTEQPQSSTSSPPQQSSEIKAVHRTVECDVCKTAPLIGFRYKCLQCHNFDLCMKCEGEMKHPDHLMLRIPNNESPILESVCPITRAFGSKRRQRKYAAAAAAAAATAGSPCGDGAPVEGKTRHHRYHRRHCGSGSGGLWANFYDMMQDLAEGGAVPQETTATETPQQQQQQQEATAPPQATDTEFGAGPGTSATAAANSQSKETNTSPDRSTASAVGPESAPRASAAAPPSFESLQKLIDPHFMEAGIQILNNFSEMFGKILDPVVTADVSRSGSTPGSVVADIDLTGGSPPSATPPPTATGTPKGTASQEASAAVSGIVTPMETEVSPPSPSAVTIDEQPRSRTSLSEENDWTMVDNNAATSTTAINADAAAAAVAAVSPPLDYAKLSQQLQSHIEKEMKEQAQTTAAPVTPAAVPSATTPIFNFSIPNPFLVAAPNSAPVLTPVAAPVVAPVAAPVVTPVAAPVVTPVAAPIATPVVAPVAAPPAPDTTERRAVAVFHADPRINSSVHAMMAMGFSNEGAMLTQLLESVNGSIPVALDRMAAAQRN